MKIFISYASDDLAAADAIAIALRNNGHTVFIDRDSLPAAVEYDDKVRKEIAASDLFMFLITPEAVAPRRYTLTELKFARHRWPKPQGNVIPVMLKDTPMASVPPYLASLNIIKPEGNVVAEVVSAIQEKRKSEKFGRVALYAGAALAVIVLGAAAVFGIGQLSRQSTLQAMADTCSVVAELVQVKTPDQLSQAAVRQVDMCRAMTALQNGDPREREVADLMAQGDVDAALDLLEKMAGQSPQNADKWDRLATLAQWRDPERAMRAREASLKLNPDDVSSRLDLSMLYTTAGRTADATAQDLEVFKRSDDPLAQILARSNLCFQSEDVIAAHPEWTCDKVGSDDLVAAYKSSRLEKEFAAEAASGLNTVRMFQFLAVVQSGNADPMELVQTMDRTIEEGKFFTNELISQTNVKGLKEALSLQLREMEIAASMVVSLRDLAVAASDNNQFEQKSAAFRTEIQGVLDQYKVLAADVQALSTRFSSPLVKIHHAATVSNQVTYLFLLRRIDADASAPAANGVDVSAINAQINEGLRAFAAVDDEYPGAGITAFALTMIYQWENMAQQMQAPEVQKVLAEQEIVWAQRMIDAEKGSTMSKVAMADALFYQWQISAEGSPEELNAKTAGLALMQELKTTDGWNDRMAEQESRLSGAYQPQLPSILDALRLDALPGAAQPATNP